MHVSNICSLHLHYLEYFMHLYTTISQLRRRVCQLALELVDCGFSQSDAMQRAWRSARIERPRIVIDDVDAATSRVHTFIARDLDAAIDMCDVRSQVYGDRHYYRIYVCYPDGTTDMHCYAPDLLLDGFTASSSHIPSVNPCYQHPVPPTSTFDAQSGYNDHSLRGGLLRLCHAVTLSAACFCASASVVCAFLMFL